VAARHITLHREGSASRDLRQILDAVAVAAGFSTRDTFILQVAVSEAVTSALVHSADDDIEVVVERRDDLVEILVSSRGVIDVERPRPHGHPDLAAEGGRRSPLMHPLVDDVLIDHAPDGTTVRLRKRLSPSHPTE